MAKELLKDVTIRNAKPADKDKRLNDGEGLYLLIKSNGAKWWRFDYTIKGKRKTLSVGFTLSLDWLMPDAKPKTRVTRSATAQTQVISERRQRRLKMKNV
jgi:hypothetical protein